jgi:hypothetical protein
MFHIIFSTLNNTRFLRLSKRNNIDSNNETHMWQLCYAALRIRLANALRSTIASFADLTIQLANRCDKANIKHLTCNVLTSEMQSLIVSNQPLQLCDIKV